MSSIYSWSKTASDNGNVDADINFAEGQAPSTLNNSNRQVMARVAELIDDLGSNVTVGGTANAITILANSAITVYATGQRLVFKAGADNTGTTTLNVNSIGTKPIRKIGSDGDADLASGNLQGGSLYEVIYSEDLNSGAGGWQLLSPLPVVPIIDPTNYVPSGSGMDFWGDIAPDGYIFAYGQAISRTTYAKLYAVFGTKFGAGNGSTTFNVPDKRGRSSFGKDDMGGTDANRIDGSIPQMPKGTTLGAAGGEYYHTLTIAELAAHTHSVSGSAASAGSHSHNVVVSLSRDTGTNGTPASSNGIGPFFAQATEAAGAHSHSVSGTAASTGSGTGHNNMPPAIVCNYIIKT